MKQRSTKDRGAARAAPSIATLRIPFELLGRILRGEAFPLGFPLGGVILPPDLRIVGATRRGSMLELKARARWGEAEEAILTATIEVAAAARRQRLRPAVPATSARAARDPRAPRARPRTPEAAASVAPPMEEGGASATSPAAAPPVPESPPELDALAEFEAGEDVYAEPKPAHAAPATYEGPGRLQVLPQGVSGAELSARRLEAIQPETVWRRGRQLVRVKEVLKAKRKRLGPPVVRVQFVELSLGSALRTISLTEFLRTSFPVLDAGRVEAVS